MNIRKVRLTFAVIILITLMSAEVIWQYRPTAWSPERQITTSPGDSRIVDVLADSQNGLHLVWEDNREGIYQVYYKHSLDNGVTWGPEVKLSNLSPGTIEPLPRLASIGPQVLVFFSGRTETGEHLFDAVGVDSGSGFSTPRQLTSDAGYQTNPAAAVAGDTFHLVWQSYVQGVEHIYYMKSPDGGATWLREIVLTDATGQDRHPAIVAVGENVLVVWSRFDHGPEAVFFRASHDAGASWQPEVQLSGYEAPVFSVFPSIASNGTHLNVAWNGGQLFYSRSANAGLAWEAPLPLTNQSRQYLAPKISASGPHLQVVTAAISPGIGRHPNISSDIYYLESPDGGKDWSEPILLTAHSPNQLSLAPAIAVRGDATFVAWQDNRNGLFAIFLMSKPDFAKLQAFERQLFISLFVLLTVATAVYLLFEFKRVSIVRRRAKRLGRRRKLARGKAKGR